MRFRYIIKKLQRCSLVSFWLLVLTHLVNKSLYRRWYLEFPLFKTALKSQLHFPSCRRVSRCKKLLTSWAWRRATMVSTPVPDLTSIMVEHITWPLDWCTRSYQAVRQTLFFCLYLHGSSFLLFFSQERCWGVFSSFHTEKSRKSAVITSPQMNDTFYVDLGEPQS